MKKCYNQIKDIYLFPRFFQTFFLMLVPFLSVAQCWTELGGTNALNANSIIACIATDRVGNIYVAGDFTDSAIWYEGHFYVAKWDGNSWSELGTGANALNARNEISCIATDAAGNVYAAGDFRDSVNYLHGHNYVAKWDGHSWTELGTGSNALNADSMIYCLTTDVFGNVYTAGRFTNSGNKWYVAKWDGHSWTELGTGANALNANFYIFTITTDPSGNVYAAGAFTDSSAPSYGYSYVAKWNGSTWSKLGTGANALCSSGRIYSITADASGNIYSTAHDSNGYAYVAKWNGSTWSQLGTGTNPMHIYGDVECIITDAAGNVYASGGFVDANWKEYVAKWDGNNWTELGTGADAINANSNIWGLATDEPGNIYATGYFTNDSGKYYVAKYGGTNGVSNVEAWQKEGNIFPNPASGKITIRAKGTVSVTDLTGKEVYKAELNAADNIIDVSRWRNGLYICTVSDGIMKKSMKLVVNHK